MGKLIQLPFAFQFYFCPHHTPYAFSLPLFLYSVSVALMTPAKIPQWWHLLEGEDFRIAQNYFWYRNAKFWASQCLKNTDDFWCFGNVPYGQVKMMENNGTTWTGLDLWKLIFGLHGRIIRNKNSVTTLWQSDRQTSKALIFPDVKCLDFPR